MTDLMNDFYDSDEEDEYQQRSISNVSGTKDTSNKLDNSADQLHAQTNDTEPSLLNSSVETNNKYVRPQGLSNLLFSGDEADEEETKYINGLNNANLKPDSQALDGDSIAFPQRQNNDNTHDVLNGGMKKVFIEEASKTSGGQGSAMKYVLYTIKFGDDSVKRRYSDFELLRNILIKLFPTILIPPIPKKQTLKSYGQSITSNDRYRKTHTPYFLPSQEDCGGIDLSQSVIHAGVKDEKLIRHRIRMLTSFLNRLLSMEEINKTSIISDFLSPDNQNYVEFINGLPSISNGLLNTNIFQLNPSNPLCTDMRIYSVLPIPHKKKPHSESTSTSLISDASKTIQQLYLSSSPSSSTSLVTPPTSDEDGNTNVATSNKEAVQDQLRRNSNGEANKSFENVSVSPNSVLNHYFKQYEHVLKSQIYKYNKKSIQHLKELQLEYNALSEAWGEFSNTNNNPKNQSLVCSMVETSNAFEESHLALEKLVGILYYNINEPLYELCSLALSAKKLVEYSNLKKTQKDLVTQLITSKTQQLEKLKSKKKSMDLERQENKPTQQNQADIPKQGSFYGNQIFKKWNQITTIVKETINYVEIDPTELIPKVETEIALLQEALGVCQKDLLEIDYQINNVELKKFFSTMDKELQSIVKLYAKNMKDSAAKNREYWLSVKKNLQK